MKPIAALLILRAASAFAAPLSDFETPQAGWQIVAPAVAWEQTGAFRGKACLSLTSTPDAAAWAASDPLDAVAPGQLFTLNFAVKRASGTGELALHLAADARAPAEPLIWRGVPSPDARWHALTLQLITGLARPRLLLGSVGGPAVWLVDDLRLDPARILPVTRPVQRTLQPLYCENLPPGWQPDGDLGLRTKGTQDYQVYYVEVGPLHLDLPREATLPRGDRSGVTFEAVSRGDASKILKIEALAPPGWRTESREVKIAGKGTRQLNVPLQAMQAGEYDVKLRFTCGGETVETPLRVHVPRQFPAFGADCQGTPSGTETFAPWVPQFSALDAAQTQAATAAGTDLALSWTGPPAAASDFLAGLAPALRDRISHLGLADPNATVADQAALAASVRPVNQAVVLASPPVQLQPSPTGPAAPPQLLSALDQGLAEGCDILALHLPNLPGSAVLRQLVDGRPPTGPMPAWSHFERAWDLLPVRTALRQRGAALPLCAERVGGLSTGDPALDALLVARLTLQVMSAGANGITLPAAPSSPGQIACTDAAGKPNQPLLTLLSELSRELAAVRSLAPPPDTDLAGYLPGKAVTYRPFMRGDEGVVALWNNTARPLDVAVEVRCRPQQVRLLRLSYPGELVQREYISEFDWDATAKHQRQSAVYVSLQPLQTVVLSMRLKGIHNQWLREVGPKPSGPPIKDPYSREAFDEALWGHE